MSSEMSKGLFERLRGVRDSAMEALAKVTVGWTSSDTYQALNAAIAKPSLMAAAMFRRATESAMTDALATLNIPSRTEVLALSQRLTRIEMALDDVGAGMDQIRRASGRQQRPPAREREGNGDRRAVATPGAKEG